MTPTTQKFVLTIGAEITMLFGFVLALGAYPATAGPFTMMAALVLPGGEASALLAPETRLLAAISGGLLMGYGVATLLLARRGLDEAPGLTRQVVLASISAWFVLDSLGSIAAGAPINALLNIGFLAIFALPFLLTGAKSQAA